MKSITAPYRKTYEVCRKLSGHISEGKFPAGELLPAENNLARMYGISRMTLRKVLGELEREGRVVRVPNRGVRVIRPGREKASKAESKVTTIGFIMAGVPDYTITRRIEGIGRYAEGQGILHRNSIIDNHEETLAALDRVEELGMDGVLVYPYRHPDYIRVLQRLVDRNIPVVSFRQMREVPVSSVGSDDGVWVYRAVYYLIERYNRPVHFVTESAELESAPERNQAYRSAMADAGFGDLADSHTWRMGTTSVDPTYWPTEKKWVPGYETGLRLLAEVPCPVSIFAHNDFTASGVCRATTERGLVVGKDVLVIGMDGLPLASMQEPGLTTLRAQVELMGFEAARLLHRLIRKEVLPPVHIRLPMEFVKRGSA